MHFFTFLLSIFFSFSVWANADLLLLEDIVQRQMQELPAHDESGSSVKVGYEKLSQMSSLVEIQNSIENCKAEDSLVAEKDETREFLSMAYSCRKKEGIVVTEVLVEKTPLKSMSIASFQEL